MSAVAEHRSRSFLDTIWARLLAAAIALGGIALFLVVNWDRVVAPVTDRGLTGSPAFQQCVEERMAAIAAMEQEAALTRTQVELHRQRAAAICQQQLAQ